MRVRALDVNGDMRFGLGSADFSIDNAAMVAQEIKTRLNLWVGQWFLDMTAGTPWLQQIIGKGTGSQYDNVFRSVILESPGVAGIVRYESNYKDSTRSLTVSAEVNTIYGNIASLQISLAPPHTPDAAYLTDDSGTFITDDTGGPFQTP